MESRIIPLLPYGLVNYSAGLTHLSYRDMALGTLIGAAPKVFAYTALGGSLGDLELARGDRGYRAAGDSWDRGSPVRAVPPSREPAAA